MLDPSSTANEQPWFALYVKPKHEKTVSRALEGKGYEQFLPLYKARRQSRTSELPLFPNYVFCKLDPENRLPVLVIPGVFFIVGAGGVPKAVENSEIAAVRRIVDCGLAAEPCQQLAFGQEVIVEGGPLRGVKGIVVDAKDSGRLIVSVSLLNRSLAVSVDPEWIAPLARSGAQRSLNAIVGSAQRCSG